MFLDYHNLKKFVIGETIKDTEVDEYIKNLIDLGLMPVILENLTLEIRTLSNEIIYEVYFNMESIGFIERACKIDGKNNQIKLEILKELLANDKKCKNKITKILIDYNASKLNLDINKNNVIVRLSLLETKDNKQKFNDSLYRIYCNILHEIYYDNLLIGSYKECSYYYSNSPSNDFNDCMKEVNKKVNIKQNDQLQRIIKKMRLENMHFMNQIINCKDDKVKVKNK